MREIKKIYGDVDGIWKNKKNLDEAKISKLKDLLSGSLDIYHALKKLPIADQNLFFKNPASFSFLVKTNNQFFKILDQFSQRADALIVEVIDNLGSSSHPIKDNATLIEAIENLANSEKYKYFSKVLVKEKFIKELANFKTFIIRKRDFFNLIKVIWKHTPEYLNLFITKFIQVSGHANIKKFFNMDDIGEIYDSGIEPDCVEILIKKSHEIATRIKLEKYKAWGKKEGQAFDYQHRINALVKKNESNLFKLMLRGDHHDKKEIRKFIFSNFAEFKKYIKFDLYFLRLIQETTDAYILIRLFSDNLFALQDCVGDVNNLTEMVRSIKKHTYLYDYCMHELIVGGVIQNLDKLKNLFKNKDDLDVILKECPQYADLFMNKIAQDINKCRRLINFNYLCEILEKLPQYSDTLIDKLIQQSEKGFFYFFKSSDNLCEILIRFPQHADKLITNVIRHFNNPDSSIKNHYDFSKILKKLPQYAEALMKKVVQKSGCEFATFFGSVDNLCKTLKDYPNCAHILIDAFLKDPLHSNVRVIKLVKNNDDLCELFKGLHPQYHEALIERIANIESNSNITFFENFDSLTQMGKRFSINITPIVKAIIQRQEKFLSFVSDLDIFFDLLDKFPEFNYILNKGLIKCLNDYYGSNNNQGQYRILYPGCWITDTFKKPYSTLIGSISHLKTLLQRFSEHNPKCGEKILDTLFGNVDKFHLIIGNVSNLCDVINNVPKFSRMLIEKIVGTDKVFNKLIRSVGDLKLIRDAIKKSSGCSMYKALLDNLCEKSDLTGIKEMLKIFRENHREIKRYAYLFPQAWRQKTWVDSPESIECPEKSEKMDTYPGGPSRINFFNSYLTNNEVIVKILTHTMDSFLTKKLREKIIIEALEKKLPGEKKSLEINIDEIKPGII